MIVESDLRTIHQDALTLAQLKAAGVNLQRDPRAQAIFKRLTDYSERTDDGLSFYRKSMVSGDGLYALAVAGSTKFLFDKMFDKLMKDLGLEFVFFKGKAKRFETWRPWKRMNERAAIGRKVADELLAAQLRQIINTTMADTMKKAVRRALDRMYKGAFDADPPPRPYTRGELRMMAARQPTGLLEVLPAPIPSVAAAVVIVPVPAAAAVVRAAELPRPAGYTTASDSDHCDDRLPC